MVIFELGNNRTIALTDEEHKALIQLGRPSSHEIIPQNALDGLMSKGVLGKRRDGRLDFTDLGEAMYHYVSKPNRRERR